MNEQTGWVEILSNNEAEALWNKLFRLVSRHSSIRTLLDTGKNGHDRLSDMFADVTQDLFLKLHQKDRWQHYLTAGYSNSDVEHELYHIEIPNMVSLLLRERYPEAYRLARRISTLLQTRNEFRLYPRSTANGDSPQNGKMTLKVYGLRAWADDKTRKPYQNMQELIKDVSCRVRDRRRAGRGSSSQIIVSNTELTRLLVEIFKAMDSPADVRLVRTLVMSKLPIEDSRFVSIDAALTPNDDSDSEPKVDLADLRPTPEQALLESESTRMVEMLASELLDKMRESVRNKPNRYRLLARVAWHCYFDMTSPSQTSIAARMGISNSLVSHYRKLFDSVIRQVQLEASQYTPFLHAFSIRLENSISEPADVSANVSLNHDAWPGQRCGAAFAAIAAR